MQYPEEFKAAVKQVYPDWLALHSAMETGSEMVGRYLGDNMQPSIALPIILAATSLKALQERAMRQQRSCELYYRWADLYQEQVVKRRSNPYPADPALESGRLG